MPRRQIDQNIYFQIVFLSSAEGEWKDATLSRRLFAAAYIIPKRRIWWRWADFWPSCCPLCRAARPGWAGWRWCPRTPGCNAGKTKTNRLQEEPPFLFKHRNYLLPWQSSAAVAGLRAREASHMRSAVTPQLWQQQTWSHWSDRGLWLFQTELRPMFG